MKHSRGFTLLELIIVILVLGIVAAVTAPMIYQAAVGSAKMYDLNQVETQGRLALERMSRELRLIRSNAASDLTLGTNQITFRDIDNNIVTYSISGNIIYRNGQPLANDVDSLTFTYQDANGAATVTNASVRYVTVVMSLTANNSTVTLENTVYLRNVS